MYEDARHFASEIGMHHYEISNWARPGRECRHNLGYWDGSFYRGVGLGAHSFLGSTRFWNSKSMATYQERIASGRLPIEAIEERTPRIRLEEAFLLGLRRLDGFEVGIIAKDLGIDYPQDWSDRVDRLQSAGLVAFDGRTLRLQPQGWLLASAITEELLCPTLLSICEATL